MPAFRPKFNKILKTDGLAIKTDDKGLLIRIPKRSEPAHIQVMGNKASARRPCSRRCFSRSKTEASCRSTDMGQTHVADVGDRTGALCSMFCDKLAGLSLQGLSKG